MTAVLAVVAVLAYLALGVASARGAHRLQPFKPDDGVSAPLAFIFGWPIMCILIGLAMLGDYALAVVTGPTRQERRERAERERQRQREVQAFEAELLARQYDLPTVGEESPQQRAHEQAQAARAVRTGRSRRPVLPGEEGVADGR